MIQKYLKEQINLNTVVSLSTGIILGVLLKKQIRSLLSNLNLLKKNTFASINRPTAGARHPTLLKKGKNPLQLYSMGTPNGQKVTVMLEELGIDYDAHMIEIGKGDQFGKGFVDINPNSKIPALVDYSENKDEGVRVFESGNILLYLAEKTGKFLPKDKAQRTECLNILFFQMGSGPFIGQYGHFNCYAPKSFWYDHSYSYERYKMEVKRLLSVLDLILKDRTYLAGEEYTIADMAWFPWLIDIDEFYKSWKKLDIESYKNVLRWFNQIKQRKAVQRGLRINQPWHKEGCRDYSSNQQKN